jgi:hypothetical protein
MLKNYVKKDQVLCTKKNTPSPTTIHSLLNYSKSVEVKHSTKKAFLIGLN